jgi:type I restriction enzyme R subunit
VPDNPELPTSPTLKLLRQYTELHPYAIAQKAKVIVETYRGVTSKAIGGRGRMMVVTASRLAAVRYCRAVREYCEEMGYDDMEVLVAFSGEVQDPPSVSGAPTYTEPGMNVGHDGEHVKESQTTREFRYWGSVLIVAEKYQTGYDEPLLHTMVIDKRLRDVKAVQTICRIDRICPGKEDTLVLDFVNSREDIQKAFQPYYAETDLAEPLDVDRIYALLEEIRGYGVYTDAEVAEACKVEFGKDRRNAQGRLKSALTPRDQALRRPRLGGRALRVPPQGALVRQVVRVRHAARPHVRPGHAPRVHVPALPLEVPHRGQGRRHRHRRQGEDGVLQAQGIQGVLDRARGQACHRRAPPAPAGVGEGKGKLDERKDPLDVLIERINEEYAGNLSEEEQEVARSVYRRSRDNKEVADALARHDDEPMFMDRWREFFRQIMMDAYTAQNGAYDSIFTDEGKYRAIMEAVGHLLYRGEK